MLTPEEMAVLAGLLSRAHAASPESTTPESEPITAGDIVQLRPGANVTWETSLMIVEQADRYKVRGPILRMHRGGCREAWYAFTPPQVARIGRVPFPRPAAQICGNTYTPPCGRQGDADQYRAKHAAGEAIILQQLRDAAALIDAERAKLASQRKQPNRVQGRKLKPTTRPICEDNNDGVEPFATPRACVTLRP